MRIDWPSSLIQACPCRAAVQIRPTVRVIALSAKDDVSRMPRLIRPLAWARNSLARGTVIR